MYRSRETIADYATWEGHVILNGEVFKSAKPIPEPEISRWPKLTS